MNVLRKPCTSCPYRKDHPSGVWDKSEYEKLRDYDSNAAIGIFLCHQTNAHGLETLCRGWVSVHCDSVAVRLAVVTGKIEPEEPYRNCGVPLHESGNAAGDAGERNLNRPTVKAMGMVGRLIKKGAGSLKE